MADIRIVRTIDTTQPITLAEAKIYLDISHTRHDDFITATIENATMRAERYLNSDILSKERTIFLPTIDEPINLPYAPIASVDSVEIDGEAQTLDQGYFVDGLDNPLVSFYGRNDAFNRGLQNSTVRNVEITYTTSGLDTDMVKNGVYALVAELYYGRTQPIKTNWRAFLSPFKTYGYYGTR